LIVDAATDGFFWMTIARLAKQLCTEGIERPSIVRF